MVLTGCQSEGLPITGSLRMVGQSMKPVARQYYDGHCLSNLLLPVQFSGALEGTAIISETIVIEGGCQLSDFALRDDRHAQGRFTGAVAGHMGAFDFVLNANVQTGDVMTGRLSVNPATAIGELAGLEMSLDLRGHGKVPVVAYSGHYRLADDGPEVVSKAGLALPAAAQLVPRIAPGVAARVADERELTFSATPPDDSPYAVVEEQINGMLLDGQVPGMAMAVIKDGKIVYLKTFGVMQIGSEQRITPTTDFGLASVVKTVTSLAIMQLVEKGKIDLDAPVTRYLPNFTLADNRYREITIRELLSHTSGLPGAVDVPLPLDVPASAPAGSALVNYVSELNNTYLYFDPGKGWAYSSIGFDILGAVVAQVSGMSYEEYVTQNIFAPLGMIDTVFFAEDVPPSRLALPYVIGRGGKPVVNGDAPYRRLRTPSSYLYSNLADLSRLLAAELNGGSLDGVQIVDSSAYETMWQPVSSTTFSYPTATQYGLGWMMGEYNGQRVISHFGIQPGYNAYIALLPEQKSGLIILCNFADEHGTIDDPALAVAEPMLDVLTTLPAGQP
jgi:CubicO group peptidase (beta-lactamase class C family)